MRTIGKSSSLAGAVCCSIFVFGCSAAEPTRNSNDASIVDGGDATARDAAVNDAGDAQVRDSSTGDAFVAGDSSAGDAGSGTGAVGHTVILSGACASDYQSIGTGANGYNVCYKAGEGASYYAVSATCPRGNRVGAGSIPTYYASTCVIPEAWLLVQMSSACSTGYESIAPQVAGLQVCGKATKHAVISTTGDCPSNFDYIGYTQGSRNHCESRVDGTTIYSVSQCPSGWTRVGADYCFIAERKVLGILRTECPSGWTNVGTANYGASVGQLNICQKNP